ncbi:MAG: PBECR4 domain-containing protein [Roseburia sp.]|nr:PBECR4 domain-containing protein [Roseburia sp.]
MENTSFKERVKNAAIANASIYEENFVKYNYLVCSQAYNNGFYVIKADKSNYLHLIGIHTNLTAEQFFEKCISTDEKQLQETDFDFNKPGKSEKSVKGSVREKTRRSFYDHLANRSIK